jgi:sec-independent protein translocase protein TatA
MSSATQIFVANRSNYVFNAANTANRTGRINMFGIGMPEMIIILVIALIVIGPQKLPDLARSLGKGLAEFKKASEGFQKNIMEEARKAGEEKKEPAPQLQAAQTEQVTSQAKVDTPEAENSNSSPELAKTLGKGLAAFKKASEEFQNNIREESGKTEDEKKEPKPQVQAAHTDHETSQVKAETQPADNTSTLHA